ncbi:CbiQ family ECF transporter T component [Actinoalloteichus hymeniacidonis]|uniref:ABC-type cobalt transport system, permease component CbiQ n=1 Tax=Actinoalloteichus hymeniacidonis TaxID=340345 RepID=A0AAC9HQ40_9PSEU|nr:CbiQ family ECF transporter T component [Actinoalloteichus hymeniacidonis]AOS63263.1 ABC-type cobalt transport system, permease component CbiQ [Actinoalloteichus hymeniacidonis]MBB5908698.1 energy-coupling factor transport system permease protein [Actinoalloteichus hymeniacidonis]
MNGVASLLGSALPRPLHPGAWWLWALALAAAASRTTNPLLLGLILTVAGYVVVQRRGSAPWAATFRMYVYLGVFVVIMRVLWRVVFGGGAGEHILFALPEITLPEAAAGIRLLGPVSAEQVLGGFYDGLRLATMLICLGAANSLADPRRMLKAVPAALYQISTSVVVALSVAPQLMESVLRVRRARRLRGGGGRGMRALRGIIVPVLADALDRSLALASAMDSRGYGRLGDTPARTRRWTGGLVIAGLLGVCVGVYGLLGGTGPVFGPAITVTGLLLAGSGFALAGRRIRRSVYRPDRWRLPETSVVICGLITVILLVVGAELDPLSLHPALSPPSWPTATLLPVLGILAGVAPAWLAPPPEVTA